MPAAAAVEILVAGCGTGRHAIMSARRFAGARVLADATSLENGHRYECDNPSTFSSMYALWARKHAPAA